VFESLEKVLSFVKESTKTFFIVGGTCAAIIFFSEEIGTQSIKDTLDPVLKVILIISSLGLFSNLLQAISVFAKTKYSNIVKKSNCIKRANSLTAQEKEVLSIYITEGVRTLSLDLNDGTTSELARCGFVFQSTGYMDGGSFCKHNITDWAWDYLNKNKGLLG
jgi:hypothetical protein